jgi:hypothetical protein
MIEEYYELVAFQKDINSSDPSSLSIDEILTIPASIGSPNDPNSKLKMIC